VRLDGQSGLFRLDEHQSRARPWTDPGGMLDGLPVGGHRDVGTVSPVTAR
jgi:hypothetical protein